MTVGVKLSKETFAVYVPEKWSSNVHNLPRMRNKDLLVALCESAQQGTDDALSGLDRAVSDEFPNIINHKRVEAQWVFWYRDQAARTSLASFLEKTPLDQANIFNIAPQDKHLTLAVVLQNDGLWLGVHLAAGAVVDRKNLATKLSKAWERERALALFCGLPEGCSIDFDRDMRPATEVDDAFIATLGERLDQGGELLRVGRHISIDEAVNLGDDLGAHLHTLLLDIVPLYRFIAWSRDNDLIDAGKQISEVKAQKRRQATAFNSGDKVRFIGGLFSGKQGVVQDVDTKAQVKVRVGKMSVVVPGGDLTLAP